MPKYLTLPDAERLLPQIEPLLRAALHHKSQHDDADRELNESRARIRISGGARVDREAMLALRARRDSSALALKESLAQIESTGALIKDLDIGLLDFLCIYRGREVCLCWKLGEDRIRFWHGLEEGFKGRKPVDEEFLRNHSGEPL